MSDIIKVCKVHGELTLEQTYNFGKGVLCKPCHSARTKKWASNNKEYCTNKSLQWQKDNKERYSEIKTKSWYKHHEQNLTKGHVNYQENKEKLIERSLERYHTNPTAASHRRLKRLFGMTQDEYDTIEREQNYKCAICLNPETIKDNKQINIRKLAVDHCHDSNKVRGLLCFKCNIGLGKFNDSIEELNNAISYLIKHQDV